MLETVLVKSLANELPERAFKSGKACWWELFGTDFNKKWQCVRHDTLSKTRCRSLSIASGKPNCARESK